MRLRTWVTPLTIGSFLVVGATGLLMFFKVRAGLINPVHEWFSLVFVSGAVLHLWVNRAAVRSHLARWRGRLVVSAFALLLVLSVIPWSSGGARGNVTKRSVDVLLESPLGNVAAVTRRTPQELRSALERRGLRVDADTASLMEVARANHASPLMVLDAALADTRTPRGASSTD